MSSIQSSVEEIDNLPKGFKKKLLRRLTDNKNDNSDALAEVITGNYDTLPEKVRNELLLKLADNKYAKNEVNALVRQNYDKLAPNIKEELLQKVDFNSANKMMMEPSPIHTKRLPNKVCVICGQKTVPSEKFGGKWGYRRIQKCDNCFFGK